MNKTGLRCATGLAIAGILLVATYYALKAGGVGGIGEVGDIGGGGILLLGYVLVGAGLITGLVTLIVERSK